MIDVSRDEAEKVATHHVAGTRYRYRGYEGTVRAVRFGERRSASKLETIRVCENGGDEPRTFTVVHGIAIDDLRTWCAERYGRPREEITLWCEAQEDV